MFPPIVVVSRSRPGTIPEPPVILHMHIQGQNGHPQNIPTSCNVLTERYKTDTLILQTVQPKEVSKQKQTPTYLCKSGDSNGLKVSFFPAIYRSCNNVRYVTHSAAELEIRVKRGNHTEKHHHVTPPVPETGTEVERRERENYKAHPAANGQASRIEAAWFRTLRNF